MRCDAGMPFFFRQKILKNDINMNPISLFVVDNFRAVAVPMKALTKDNDENKFFSQPFFTRSIQEKQNL